jgi:hypothetical protein
MSENKPVSIYGPGRVLLVDDAAALSEAEFYYVIARHFLGEQAAWELVRYIEENPDEEDD